MGIAVGGALVGKKRQRHVLNIILEFCLMNFFWRSGDVDKRLVKLLKNKFHPQLSFFLDVCFKISILTYGAWSFRLIQIGFTPSEGPNNFVVFIFKMDHGCWTIESEHKKNTIFHGPMSWSMV